MNTSTSPRSSAVLQLVTVKVAREMSRVERPRFVRPMQRAIGVSRLIAKYPGGFCIAVKEREANWHTERHHFVNEPIDHEQGGPLVILPPVMPRRVPGGEDDLHAKALRLSKAKEAVSRWLIRRVPSGLMTRANLPLHSGVEI